MNLCAVFSDETWKHRNFESLKYIYDIHFLIVIVWDLCYTKDKVLRNFLEVKICQNRFRIY